jgi:hypothetical protein
LFSGVKKLPRTIVKDRMKMAGQLGFFDMIELIVSLLVIALYSSLHKVRFCAAEASKSFRHKHGALAQGQHLFRCHLGLYRPKPGMVP